MPTGKNEPRSPLMIGWAETDITPQEPVMLIGQFYARVSEEVMDPLTATVLALKSGDEHAVFVSCDLIGITDELWDAIRNRLGELTDDIDPMKVVLNATHTHTGPDTRIPFTASRRIATTMTATGSGVELDAFPIEAYIAFAAKRITDTILRAWQSRAAGGVAFGLGYAVLGRNRRWVDVDGVTIKGMVNGSVSHIEGYEDHSLHLLAVYDAQSKLTGLLVNVPCPSQVSESQFAISADYWHETRIELRRRFGDRLFILPQCSAAGDLAPGPFHERAAHDRMLELKGRSTREELACRIADAVGGLLPYLSSRVETAPILRHAVELVELEATHLTEEDARVAQLEAEKCRHAYEMEMQKLAEQPQLRSRPRWYVAPSTAYRRMNWHRSVVQRYERQLNDSTYPVELHMVRLGQIALATNPFELYLDYGIQIKAQSPAVQTFLVQLAGAGTYLPSQRSCMGGAYGSVPGSCQVGPEGGRQLVEHTVKTIHFLWDTWTSRA